MNISKERNNWRVITLQNYVNLSKVQITFGSRVTVIVKKSFPKLLNLFHFENTLLFINMTICEQKLLKFH